MDTPNQAPGSQFTPFAKPPTGTSVLLKTGTSTSVSLASKIMVSVGMLAATGGFAAALIGGEVQPITKPPQIALTITTQSPLPSAEIGQRYAFQLQASGGTAPLNWGVVSGNLPNGLYLQGDQLLYGEPTGPADLYHFTVRVEDSTGKYANRDFDLMVTNVRYTLSARKIGTGGGDITSVPEGIRCGADCTENYLAGNRITLTAAAAVGSKFAGWSGACSGTSTCMVIINSAKSVTANFTRITSLPAAQ